MTDPQQKEIDELLEQIRQEEEICEKCRSKNSFTQSEECDGCEVHSHVEELERLIRSLSDEGEE